LLTTIEKIIPRFHLILFIQHWDRFVDQKIIQHKDIWEKTLYQLTNFFLLVQYFKNEKMPFFDPHHIFFSILIVSSFLGFIFPSLFASYRYWLILTLGQLWIITQSYLFLDNRFYVVFYWLVFITYDRYQRQTPSPSSLPLSSYTRCFLGLIIFLAGMSKLCSTDFRNGHYIYYQMMTNPRFIEAFSLIPSSSLDFLFHNQDLINQLYRPLSIPVPSLQLQPAPLEIQTLSFMISILMITIEILVGCCFLLPKKKSSFWIDHLCFLLFLYSVYSFLPVSSAGYMMILIFLTQIDLTSKERRTIPIYLLCLVSFFVQMLL
jgi:hypothetical protein